MPDKPSSPPESPAVLFGDTTSGDDPVDPRDDQIAELQKSKQDLENKLYEERFLWILVIVVIINMFVLTRSDNWAAPLVLGIFQLVGLVVVASKCRVDPIMPLLDRLAGMMLPTKNGSTPQ